MQQVFQYLNTCNTNTATTDDLLRRRFFVVALILNVTLLLNCSQKNSSYSSSKVEHTRKKVKITLKKQKQLIFATIF